MSDNDIIQAKEAFYRIIDVTDGIYVTARKIDSQCCLGSHYFHWKKARVVPWTFRNAPDTFIKVKGINEHGYADVISRY